MKKKVIKRDGENALVDFNGNQVNAIAGLVDVAPGDYVLVHAGCIIQKMNTKEAQDLVDLFEEINQMQEEMG